MAGGTSSRVKVAALIVVLAFAGLAAVGVYIGLSHVGVPRQLTIPEQDCGLLQSFTSLDDMRAHLKESPRGWPWIYQSGLIMGPGAAAGGPVPYSGTNNQVAGVDEPDIVKTDGTFLYTATVDASGSWSVSIVRAYPPGSAALVSRIPVDSWVQGLFIDGTRLAVILGGYDARVLSGGAMMPWSYRPLTRMLVYDVSDPVSPALARNITVSGSYVGGRLIGDVATLVVQDYLYLIENGTAVVLPTITTDGVPRDLTYADIGYFADSAGSNADTIVLSMDLTKAGPPAFESFFTRGVFQMYMSAANLYVAGVEWDANWLRTAVAETTTVHKVSVGNAGPHYVCSVRVPGSVLNQFSMDESAGDLRVATTLGQWSENGQATSAAVFVFDPVLNPLGSLTGMAPGERIFSARFLGERAYLVTFRRVDPLFVLDVSDPRAPKVLGFLKMPGVSDYLHPFDATHILGLGQADPEGSGRLRGIKLSLFDVADVDHPAEVASVTIGTATNESAWSEATYDHRAFLLVPDPSLVVIPASIYRYDGSSSSWWQGAYVFDVNVTSGLRIRGTIAHMDSSDGMSWWLNQVRRSLYIGDFLYTVSDSLILGNRIDTLAEGARAPL